MKTAEKEMIGMLVKSLGRHMDSVDRELFLKMIQEYADQQSVEFAEAVIRQVWASYYVRDGENAYAIGGESGVYKSVSEMFNKFKQSKQEKK